MLHVDDELRLTTWRQWLARDSPPSADATDPLQLMLFTAVGFVRRPTSELAEAWHEIWADDALRRELAALLDELDDRRRRPTYPLSDSPFHVHATYSRDEVSAGLRQLRKNDKLLRLQAGVYCDRESRSDILFVTLDKDEKHFTPTTLYNDYPISQTLFHWESQGSVRADSDTGRRYQTHASQDWRILLFVRRRKHDRGITSPYLFLGPVRYHSHQREKPMQITWSLDRPMPPDFWRDVKLAAG